MQAYSNPKRESDPYALPDLEVFEVWTDDKGKHNAFYFYTDGFERGGCEEDLSPDGWYYWFCFPGCLPDSDPEGPFDTKEEALADAQHGAEEES
jgi:hypothetical protein